MRQIVSRQRVRHFESGFTLIELIIMIGFLSLMAGVGLEFLIRAGETTNFRTTVKRMDAIREALLDYSKKTIVDRYGSQAGSTQDGIILRNMEVKDLPTILSSSGLSVSISPEAYVDGWGQPIQYFGPDGTGGTAQTQAVAHLVSAGPDQVLQYSYADPTSFGDDLVYKINCIPIFAEEANARVALVNLALAKRRTEFAAVLGSPGASGDPLPSGVTPLANSYATVLYVLRQDPDPSAKALSDPYLPPRPPSGLDRYASTTWNVANPILPKGGINAYPVSEVEAIQP